MAYGMAIQGYEAQGFNANAGNGSSDEAKLSDQSSCRVILQQLLTQRQRRNARYSLRAFARDLHMSPSFLSEVLNGKYGLSKHLANQIAERLGFCERERLHFCNLADLDVTDSRTRRSRRGRSRRNPIEAIEIENLEDALDTQINDLREAIQKMMRQTQGGSFIVQFRS